MEITEIKIFKTNREGPVLAYANIILNDMFIIRGITLLNTEKNGRFISMPARRLRTRGKRVAYRDICHPLNQDIRTELTEKIFEAYDEFIKLEKN